MNQMHLFKVDDCIVFFFTSDFSENMDIIYIITGVVVPVVFLIIIALVVSDALCKKKKW